MPGKNDVNPMIHSHSAPPSAPSATANAIHNVTNAVSSLPVQPIVNLQPGNSVSVGSVGASYSPGNMNFSAQTPPTHFAPTAHASYTFRF